MARTAYKSDKITASWWTARRRDREWVVARVPFDVGQSARNVTSYRQLSELTGHDLMCFCEPVQSCHADTLLRLSAPRVR